MDTSEISKAIIAVMKQVRGMEKNSRVGSGSAAYDGTRDQDVKEAFNVAMAENGLCILPIGIEEETELSRWEETYNGNAKQKQSVFTKVRTKYLLLHESGQSIELAGYGHGVDAQDKGAGKALTYALKNTLLYSFLTPVGKIDDTDTTHSNDIPAPAPPTKRLTDPEKVAKHIEKADHWTKATPLVPKDHEHNGKTFEMIAFEGDTKFFEKVMEYIDPTVIDYPNAMIYLKAATAEAYKNAEGGAQ